jgi:hypothetical protein
VEYKTNLLQPFWSSLGGQIGATGSTTWATDTLGSDPRRFYRVGLLP